MAVGSKFLPNLSYLTLFMNSNCKLSSSDCKLSLIPIEVTQIIGAYLKLLSCHCFNANRGLHCEPEHIRTLWMFKSWGIWYLVGGLEHFLFSHILGMALSQMTFIFSEGLKPPTRNDILHHELLALFGHWDARLVTHAEHLVQESKGIPKPDMIVMLVLFYFCIHPTQHCKICLIIYIYVYNYIYIYTYTRVCVCFW